MLNFDNRFLRELPGETGLPNMVRQVSNILWSSVTPTPVAAPRLLAYSPEVASSLDLDDAAMRSPSMAAALAGNAILPGSVPYATRYGGHQFGNWAGQLGDGRAIYLGEVVNKKGERVGERYELQLKGAGRTPYSRGADGRAVLRSSIREFLCSEAMHHLGIPTTRALSLVETGDRVVRDMFYDGRPAAEPGAIVCRVAPSFTRFGHFEILAARGELDLLKKLVDFTIDRDFSDLNLTGSLSAPVPGSTSKERLPDWFSEVCTRTAKMVAEWMRVGFVHGVMNTDNMSILGLTIDYGPYGWIDNFDPGWTPNTTDAEGKRYCFGRQPEIARWNLERLASALATIHADHDELSECLNKYDEMYSNESARIYAGKFGFTHWQDSDATLIGDVFDLMQRAEVDMTEFFRKLAEIDVAALAQQSASNNITEIIESALGNLHSAFYVEALFQQHRADFADWLTRYAQRASQDHRPAAERLVAMNQLNPRYVLRNYLAQQAIDRAEQGDASMVTELLDVMRNPYTVQAGREAFSAIRPDWARQKAGCSMLSCSS